MSSDPVVTRYEVDESRTGRAYGELRVFVRFPGYTNDAAHNERVWALVDRLAAGHREWRLKDGYLHGHVAGCGPDEILATRGLR